ncbi:MAG TPA: recombinase RecT [Acidimicrobiia bacterium]
MAGSELAERVEAAAEKPSKGEHYRRQLEKLEPQLRLALTKSDGSPIIDPQRFARIALTSLRTTKGLLECSEVSILGAIVSAAQLGLEPGGPLGHAYLVPFKKECQLIIGYQGMIQLALRSGMVSEIQGRVVHDGDHFEYEYGTNQYLRHVPAAAAKPEITHAYAHARLVTGGSPFVVLTKNEVDAVRARSKGADRESSPWNTDYEAMARKTAVRQLFKWLPASVEFQAALGADQGIARQIPGSIEDLSDPDVIDVVGEEES